MDAPGAKAAGGQLDPPPPTLAPTEAGEEEKKTASSRWHLLRLWVRNPWHHRRKGSTPAAAVGHAEEEEKPPAAAATLKTTQLPGRKKHEARLEKILEDGFARLLAPYFDRLSEPRRRCLLAFSVLPVGRRPASVRKMDAAYWWWGAQFGDLPLPQPPDGAETKPPPPQTPPRGAAEEIFDDLCDIGYLEPIKSRCSGVLRGCRVNPLVHWMVKRKARDDGFAGLDERGNPAGEQRKSGVLCRTASHREWLQKIGRQRKKPGPARTPSKEGPQQSSGRAKVLPSFWKKSILCHLTARPV